DDGMSCFLFSSRRRHTRFSRDWSSDVCSSDLGIKRFERAQLGQLRGERPESVARERQVTQPREFIKARTEVRELVVAQIDKLQRSEERRVGNEWRTRRERRR